MMRAVAGSAVCVVGLALGAQAWAEDGEAPPAPVAEAAVEEPVAEGHLEVNSKPWSLVQLDGVEIGQTPLKAQTLSAGVHAVEFTCTACSPPRSHREMVVVEEGRTRSIVHRFDDGWTRMRSTPLPERKPLVVADPPPMERMLVHEGQPSGELLVNSKPWSTVMLNDYDLGAVPLDVTLTPGEYVVTLACEVCDPPQTRTERVSVSLDDTTRLIVLFDEE